MGFQIMDIMGFQILDMEIFMATEITMDMETLAGIRELQFPMLTVQEAQGMPITCLIEEVLPVHPH
jgi:hypothetical protein